MHARGQRIRQQPMDKSGLPHRRSGRRMGGAKRYTSLWMYAAVGFRCAQPILRFFAPPTDSKPSMAGRRIKRLAIAFEVRRVGGLESGGRHPVAPDRTDGAADG